jgi:polysaccharide pyruvyl transferase WcaK-like protein
MKINIVGWYGNKNIGDEAFRDVFNQHLTNLTFSELPDLTADAIILGGGGVMGGNYLTGLETYKGPLYGIGVDIALNGPQWEALKQLPFKRIYVRSREYADLAKKELSKIVYCPDLAFSLFDENRVSTKQNRFGIILSQDLAPHLKGDKGNHIATALRSIGVEVVFITLFQKDGSDHKMNLEVATKSRLPLFSLLLPSTPTEALNLISSLDFVVSMRFHGAIFAALTGVPFIALANKGKCSLFCEQEGLFEHYIELAELTEYKLLHRIEHMRKLPSKRQQLLDLSCRNKLALHSVFEQIKTELGGKHG